MNKVVKYYEAIGDSSKGRKAEIAYRKAQDGLSTGFDGYIVAMKRIQKKIEVAMR